MSKFGSNEQFVDSAVKALLGNGAVMECERSFLELVSPLNVVEQRDKLRLIHDLKHLNQFLVWPKFKYESLASLCDILSPGDYMVSVDVQSAISPRGSGRRGLAVHGILLERKILLFSRSTIRSRPGPSCVYKDVPSFGRGLACARY